MGTAVLLGTFSYTYWLSQIEPESLAEINQQPSFSRLFWAGFLLILLSLIFTSSRWWETAVWLLFTVWTLFNFIGTMRKT